MSPDRLPIRSLLASLLCGLVGIILLSSSTARAGDAEKKNFIVSKWSYSRLSKAHQAIAKGRYAEATKIMESMKKKKRLNDHEKALMWQTIGYIHSSREKYSAAIQAFEKCLSKDALPKGADLDIRFNLGQLYMASRKYNKAAQVLTDWIGRVEKPSADAKYMLALALTQTKEWKKALGWAKQAVAGKRRPQEGWLQLLMSIHFELKQNRQVAEVLKRLIVSYPKKSYWMQLSAMYAELGQTERALAVLELCHRQGFLQSGSELKNLASLYMHHGVPMRSAQILSQALKDGKIERSERHLTNIGEAWLRAREFSRALGPLSQAAKISSKGDLWIRVAHIHMEREAFGKAAAALSAALKKGKLTDKGNAQLLLGIVLMRDGKYARARTALIKAQEYANTRNAAKTWLKSLAEKSRPKS